MSAIDELQDIKNWDLIREYGPHDYSGTVYSWIGYSTPIDLIEQVASELDEAHTTIRSHADLFNEFSSQLAQKQRELDHMCVYAKELEDRLSDAISDCVT